MKKIAVIGGGPAGITASYIIKKNHPDYQVILFEKDNQIGKRIKVSGNGRCNISNSNILSSDYYNGEKIEHILSSFNRDFFNELHLHLYSDEEGRIYPLTNSSKTVQDAFIKSLKKIGVEFHVSESFLSYQKKDKYLLKTNLNEYSFDKLIFASGGASYLYNKEDYLSIIKSLDVRIETLSSSLTPIIIKEKLTKEVVGKRSKAEVSLYYKDQFIRKEKGEIIFKKDGISGIVIFNMTFYIDRNDISSYSLKIDFASGIKEETLIEEIKHYSLQEVLQSYVVNEIADLIIKENNVLALKNYHLSIASLYPLKESQVTRGGILLDEINLNNLSLKKDHNIYVCGEMINVDGLCGGYNLHFAIASGYFVGNNID